MFPAYRQAGLATGRQARNVHVLRGLCVGLRDGRRAQHDGIAPGLLNMRDCLPLLVKAYL